MRVCVFEDRTILAGISINADLSHLSILSPGKHPTLLRH